MRQAVRAGRRAAALLIALGVLALLPAASASAHPISTSAVLLDVGRGEVHALVELPLDELGTARGRTFDARTVLEPDVLAGLRTYVGEHLGATDPGGRPWSTSTGGGRVETIDGTDHLVLDATLVPPSGTVGDFVLHDDVIIDPVVSHRIFVSARPGEEGDYTALGMLSWQTTEVAVTAFAPSGGQGFVSALHLGTAHIGEGSDHLLFLVMLLLPAPLVVTGRGWSRRSAPGRAGAVRSTSRVLHVVTAFAVGHSCTLVLGALGLVDLPVRLVEGGIAVSVLVSAVHALRPLVRRGEVAIAVGFGLLHGAAFARALADLDLSRSSLVTTLLGFNLGIELAQLLVVALLMPALLLLARTGAYVVLRVVLAGAGAVLALGWVAERTGLVAVNPLGPVADTLVRHPFLLAGALLTLALGATLWQWRRRTPEKLLTEQVPLPAGG